jgi:putative tryptophan/tyrosine transport system substrate-binding protein
MDRRTFITRLAGVLVAAPHLAHAQQPAIPAIGFLRSTPSAPFANIVAAFREGLKEAGFLEGQNVAIEQRWADNQLDRMPGLAAELVARKVAVIVGNSVGAAAAKAATSTIPIVFVSGEDPVRSGLVTNLSRPGANVTGITFFSNTELVAKRLELLHELAPKATVIAVLTDPNYSTSDGDVRYLEAAARAIGLKTVVVKASSERELEPAFAAIGNAGAGALVVSGNSFMTSQSRQLAALAARHAIPAIYDVRDHAVAGGLISYAASFTGAYRQAGVYAGNILKGAKPSAMPVLQPSTFELVINLKTAKALGLTVPQSVLLCASRTAQR